MSAKNIVHHFHYGKTFEQHNRSAFQILTWSGNYTPGELEIRFRQSVNFGLQPIPGVEDSGLALAPFSENEYILSYYYTALDRERPYFHYHCWIIPTHDWSICQGNISWLRNIANGPIFPQSSDKLEPIHTSLIPITYEEEIEFLRYWLLKNKQRLDDILMILSWLLSETRVGISRYPFSENVDDKLELIQGLLLLLPPGARDWLSFFTQATGYESSSVHLMFLQGEPNIEKSGFMVLDWSTPKRVPRQEHHPYTQLILDQMPSLENINVSELDASLQHLTRYIHGFEYGYEQYRLHFDPITSLDFLGTRSLLTLHNIIDDSLFPNVLRLLRYDSSLIPSEVEKLINLVSTTNISQNFLSDLVFSVVQNNYIDLMPTQTLELLNERIGLLRREKISLRNDTRIIVRTLSSIPIGVELMGLIVPTQLNTSNFALMTIIAIHFIVISFIVAFIVLWPTGEVFSNDYPEGDAKRRLKEKDLEFSRYLVNTYLSEVEQTAQVLTLKARFERTAKAIFRIQIIVIILFIVYLIIVSISPATIPPEATPEVTAEPSANASTAN
jgi:hypothetical protein